MFSLGTKIKSTFGTGTKCVAAIEDFVIQDLKSLSEIRGFFNDPQKSMQKASTFILPRIKSRRMIGYKTKDRELMFDYTDKVSEIKQYLRDGEKVIHIEEIDFPQFESLPHYHAELCKLCGVEKPEDIGKNGPAMAARAIAHEEGQGLFECRFGRDGLIAANNLLSEFPLLTRTTLLDYASLIGMIENSQREEEFGRMFHEARDLNDPIAKKLSEERGWGWPFYATVDATPLFVNTLFNYIISSDEGTDFLNQEYVGRDQKIHTMKDAICYSMMWITRRINQNHQCFLEYKRNFERSLENQVMEDSWDSRFHVDGNLADMSQSICSTEVQGLVYDSLLSAAQLLENDPEYTPEAAYYRKLAKKLRTSIFNYLWIEDDRGGYFAPGCDRDENGQIRVMKVRKAIPFFLLNSRLFDEKTQEDNRILTACIRTIFDPTFLCAAGIRSLAKGETRYMPGAYHNGSSWPMQTFNIAEGLRRQGFSALANELDRRIEAAIEQTKIYPEYVHGDNKDIRINQRILVTYDPADGRKNRREQPPQQIQLWSLTAYGAIQHRKKTLRENLIQMQPIEQEILSSILLV